MLSVVYFETDCRMNNETQNVLRGDMAVNVSGHGVHTRRETKILSRVGRGALHSKKIFLNSFLFLCCRVFSISPIFFPPFLSLVFFSTPQTQPHIVYF